MSIKENNKIRHGIIYALGFSLISLIWVFNSIGKISWRVSLGNLNWFYIWLGFLVMVFTWLSKAYRMFIICKGMGCRIPFSECIQLYLATCFISHVTPFNSGGTPLQIYLLHKSGMTLGKASALTVIDLGLHSAGFLLLIIWSVVFQFELINKLHFQQNAFFWAILSVIVIFGITTPLLVKNFRKLKKFSWIKSLRSKLIHQGWLKRLHHELSLFKEGSVELLKKNPAAMVSAILATVAYWFCYLSLAPLIIWSLNLKSAFSDLIAGQLFFNLAQVLVPTPGGSGGSELILTYLFRNLAGEKIGTFVLFWKVFTFFSTLLIGGYFFWKLTRKKVS